LSFVLSVGILKLFQLGVLEGDLVLLSLEILFEFLVFDFELVGMFSLLFDLFAQIVGHELDFLLEHKNSLLGLLRFLLEEFVLVRKVVVDGLFLEVQLRKIAEILLEILLFELDAQSLLIFLLEHGLSLLSLISGVIALLVEGSK